MKKILIKFSFIACIIFSITSCASPEDRAVEVVDSTENNPPPAEGQAVVPDSSSKGNQSTDTTDGISDSATSSKKVETFKHTPIDTITSLQDSSN